MAASVVRLEVVDTELHRVEAESFRGGGVEAEKAFFMYGFPKSARENVDTAELRALKKFAKELLSYSKDQLRQALDKGALTEVRMGEDEE